MNKRECMGFSACKLAVAECPLVPFDCPCAMLQSDRLGYQISFSEAGGVEIEENWDKVCAFPLQAMTNNSTQHADSALTCHIRAFTQSQPYRRLATALMHTNPSSYPLQDQGVLLPNKIDL